MDKIGISFEFTKADATGRYVRGWASVVSVGGKDVVDHQGDVVKMEELRKAAHQFIIDARVAKVMHDGDQKGEVVESVLVDDQFAKALDASTDRRGWFVGMIVHDPAVQKRIASGDLRMFSIGGRGKRRAMEGGHGA
jgi:hypothetical protein